MSPDRRNNIPLNETKENGNDNLGCLSFGLATLALIATGAVINGFIELHGAMNDRGRLQILPTPIPEPTTTPFSLDTPPTITATATIS